MASVPTSSGVGPLRSGVVEEGQDVLRRCVAGGPRSRRLSDEREAGCPGARASRVGGSRGLLRLRGISARLQGLAVAPGRLRWFYASVGNLGRGAPPPRALCERPFPAPVVNTDASNK